VQKRARILVVVEVQPECDELCYLLEGEGYEVDQALCAAEALDRVAREGFDLVLVEIPVAGIDGLEMLRRIREQDPGAVVIVIGGDAALGATIAAWQHDISGYIARPLDDPDQLLALITRGLADRGGMPAGAAIPTLAAQWQDER